MRNFICLISQCAIATCRIVLCASELLPNAQLQSDPQRESKGTSDDIREMIRKMKQEIKHEIRNIHAEIYDIRNRSPQHRDNGDRTPPEERTDTVYNFTPDDIRRRRGRGFLPLKEARGMIPKFDGLPNKLQEFLEARLHMPYLQIEFNTLKQKLGESAQTYGFRADKLAMKLYESMTKERHHTVDNKRAIMEIIQQQVVENFQIGLQNDIKMIVRARGYVTLQEAASAEEKVKEPSAIGTRIKQILHRQIGK
ncbi:hypothetical protein ACFW04_003711 [Cataglyphis niger]